MGSDGYAGVDPKDLLPDGGAAAAPLLVGGAAGDERMGIDDMLRRHAGEFGPWQMRHFVLTNAAWALEALHTMVMIFADRDVPIRCVSRGGPCGPYPCGMEAGTWEWVGSRAASTVSEWGLVCGDKYKVGLVQSGFFAGCVIGAGVFGHLSDTFLGRKGSLTVVCILNTIFGLLTALSASYWVYVALRFLTGFSTGGVGLCAFVLATEPVGPTKRGIAGMSTFYFFSGGIALLSGIAYVFPTWRALYVVTSLPSLLFVLAVLPFVSESPRWYLVRGRITKAMDIMRRIAQTNGNHLPLDITLVLDNENEEDGDTTDQKIVTDRPISGSMMDVLRMPLTRVRLILAVAINLLCSIVYFGLNLNVVNLKTNLYLSVFLNAVSELPAYLLTAMLIDRVGRKPLGIGTMFLSGGFCLIASSLGTVGAMNTMRVACGLLGIFGMAATYNLLFIYTSELFPTVVRNAALGCVSQAAQMGAILAPLVVVLGERVPFAVFGVCGIVGGLLVFYLPETGDKPLYDTMEGLEDGERRIRV